MSFKNNCNDCRKPRHIKLFFINTTKEVSHTRYLKKNKVSIKQQSWAMTSLLYLKEFTWLNRPHETGLALLPHLQKFDTLALLALFSSPKMSYSCKIQGMDFPLPGMLSIKILPDLLVFILQISAQFSFSKESFP